MVFLAIISSVGASILAQYCNKKLTRTESVEKLLMRLFFGCAVLGWTAVLFFSTFNFNFYVAALGFAGFWAMWSFTNGIKIGLAQTILVLPATTIVAVLLSAVFYRSGAFLIHAH